jgi:hypothetical protein
MAQVFSEKMAAYFHVLSSLITPTAALNQNILPPQKVRSNPYWRTLVATAICPGEKSVNGISIRNIKMKAIKNITLLFSFLVSTLAMPAVYAEQEIDTNWKSVKTSIDFIDVKQRLIVVADREFEVPFNTYIVNSNNKAIALSKLQVGNRIWLYMDASGSQIKRIEKLK